MTVLSEIAFGVRYCLACGETDPYVEAVDGRLLQVSCPACSKSFEVTTPTG